MMDSKIAVCPICGKKTLLRIQNGAYLNEYPIRVNCVNCKTLIKGSYVMNSKSRINGLYLINADIEECFPDTKTLTIPGVDYVAEISGELPCRNVRVYEDDLPISPFLRSVDNLESVEDRINRLTYFVNNMTSWKRKKSTAFQLLDEGSIDYIAKALNNRMGEYLYECDHYLKSLHCLQEIVLEETKYLFVDPCQDDYVKDIISKLVDLDSEKLSVFVQSVGGIQELIRLYRKTIEVFSLFMNIYPNLLPAETYLHFTKRDNENVCISTCSFSDIKTFYQDAYEALSFLLFFPVCLDNIAERNDYLAFNSDINSKIRLKMNDRRNTDIVNEFQAYCILDNGFKLAKVNPRGEFQGLMELPRNSYLRNGIGHNNYKYDGITQKVTAYDLKNPEMIKYQGSLMDVAIACVGMAKSTVGISEIILFLLRTEFKKEGIRTIRHPRFYTGLQPNDRCPCGSGMKYKKCCRNEIENIMRQVER